MKSRLARYGVAIALVIAAGVISRAVYFGAFLPFGAILIDKYLGDALYALLGHALLGAVFPGWRPGTRALVAGAAMIAIESFQLTGIPLGLRQSGQPALVALSIVLGTTFSWLDMLAYAPGVAGGWWLERQWLAPPDGNDA